MKRCQHFRLVLPFLLLIPQWPVEQNCWKKQLSKVSPCKEQPFANHYQVSAVISPSHSKILQVSPAGEMLSRSYSERTPQFPHCPFVDHVCQLSAASLQCPRAAPHTALLCSSQKGCTNALQIFCSLQPPMVHVIAWEAKPRAGKCTNTISSQRR